MKKQILVVDDDVSVRQSLARVLEDESYSVQLAANGNEALTAVNAQRIDLVLLDLNMPVLPGWETFERLCYEHPLLPVIIITARPNQRFQALASGVGALMEKPLDFPVLLETVTRLLAESTEQRRARLAGKAAAFHYAPPSGLALDRS
jgi:two-component system, OmpR family, response regulator MprA